jgi:hypothetical protein
MYNNSFAEILELIYEWYGANNADNMDHKIVNGDYVALIHHDLNTANGFSSPTNAVFTVPVGKKAVVIKAAPTRTVVADPTYRGLRLFDTANNLDVLRRVDFPGAVGIPDGGTDTSGKIPEASAGAVVELQTWNNGTASRIRGGFAVLRVVDVP